MDLTSKLLGETDVATNDPQEYYIDTADTSWTAKGVANAIRGALIPSADGDLAKRVDYLLLHLGREGLIDLYNRALGMPHDEIEEKVRAS